MASVNATFASVGATVCFILVGSLLAAAGFISHGTRKPGACEARC